MTLREQLEQAFSAGYACAVNQTDKFGEYHGDSIREEFREWYASLSVSAEIGERRPHEKEEKKD